MLSSSSGMKAKHETAAARALRIPHILRNIFQQFSSRGSWLAPLEDSPSDCTATTLLHCMLVCSSWAYEAAPVLWNDFGGDSCTCMWHSRGLRQFARISAERRQIYANYIKILNVDYHISARRLEGSSTSPSRNPTFAYGAPDGLDLLELRPLSFPRLASLTIGAPYVCDEDEVYSSIPLTQFVQPNLTALTLWVSNGNHYVISDRFLDLLQSRVV